jgi:molybdopterin-guanine dinucleotide biosynthesis protein A
LLEAAEQSAPEALIPVGPSGLSEPLCAVYSRRVRPALESAFSRGVRKVMAALEGIRLVSYPVSEGQYFQNVNTPEEWAAHAE